MNIFSPWDIIPILGIIAIIIAFCRKRSRMKREEAQLRETLTSLRSGFCEGSEDSEVDRK